MPRQDKYQAAFMLTLEARHETGPARVAMLRRAATLYRSAGYGGLAAWCDRHVALASEKKD